MCYHHHFQTRCCGGTFEAAIRRHLKEGSWIASNAGCQNPRVGIDRVPTVFPQGRNAARNLRSASNLCFLKKSLELLLLQ